VSSELKSLIFCAVATFFLLLAVIFGWGM